jgi:hypothetical protein
MSYENIFKDTHGIKDCLVWTSRCGAVQGDIFPYMLPKMLR